MIQYLQQNYICEFIFAAKNYYAWQLAVVLIKIQLREIYENTNTVHISKLKQTSFWKDLCIHIDMCVYTLLVWPTGNHAYLIMITYTYIYISWTSAELATILCKCESPWILATFSATHWISLVRENEKSGEGGTREKITQSHVVASRKTLTKLAKISRNCFQIQLASEAWQSKAQVDVCRGFHVNQLNITFSNVHFHRYVNCLGNGIGISGSENISLVLNPREGAARVK